MAVKHWVGGAVAVYDVWDLTLAGTWAATETATITVNGKNFVVTSGGSDKAQLATEIIAGFNASRFDDPAPPSGYARNVGGQQVLEMAELSAGIHPTDVNKVRLTARSPGNPITVSASDTAAAGTFTEAHTTSATGPEFLDNAANWSGGALPVSGDILRFDQGNVSAKYGLTYLRANAVDCDWIITEDWGGALGLPIYNETTGYREYRQRYAQYFGDSSNTFSIIPGLQSRTSHGTVRVDFQDQADLAIKITGERFGTGDDPTVFLAGTAAAGLLGAVTITAGNVAIEPDEAPTGATKYFASSSYAIGTPANASGTPIVTFGKNTRVHLSDGITENSGSVVSYAGTDVGADEAPITILGGSFEGVDNTFAAADVYKNGTLFASSTGGFGAVNCYGGTIDTRRGAQLVSISALKIYPGSSAYLSNLGGSGLFDLIGCSNLDLTAFELPPNRAFDISGAASP